MEKLTPYLTFPGTCEAAFNFYKTLFGGEFSSVSRFSDLSSDDDFPMPEYKLNKIIHIELNFDKQVSICGSDCDEAWCEEVLTGNNMALLMRASSKQHANTLFEELSKEGTVQMQIGDDFSGNYHGVCTDKFGISWKISYVK